MGGTAIAAFHSAESPLWGLPSETETGSVALESGNLYGVPYWSAAWTKAFEIQPLQISYIGSVQSGIPRTVISQGGNPTETGDTFGTQFHRVDATWTVRSFQEMRVGVTATGYFEAIDTERAYHPSIGLTILEPAGPDSPWSWLLGISNILSTGHAWSTGRVDETIRTLRLGGAGPVWPTTAAAIELAYSQTGYWFSQPFHLSQLTLSLGGEVLVVQTETMKGLFVRTGLKDMSLASLYTPQWTAGIGMQFRDWQLDYAYVMPLHAFLEQMHRFQVTVYLPQSEQ
ncbi:MAG: hypothetical protein AAB066_05365 [Candidatus Margulisiibacteriota bacterium]